MTDPRNSDEGPAELQGGGLSIADVYYVLFKHKGKIAFFVFAALIAAGYPSEPPAARQTGGSQDLLDIR